jgi:putative tricarboxylic transport membrane protein
MALMDLFTIGFPTAFSFENLLYCFTGVFLGTFIGVLPGVGSLAAVALLLPVTFYLDPTTALVMLAGVYYGAEYGGSTASILLNLPGTPSSAVTCLDGYPMTRQGRAGVALFITTISSFIGGSFGILLLMFFAPAVVAFALSFGPAEYFAAMLFGLIGAATISQGSPLKGLAMVALGLLLGTVGTDVHTGVQRYTYGFPQLFEGFSLVVLAMGLFGVSEIIASIRGQRDTKFTQRITLRGMIPSREDMRRIVFPLSRGMSVGGIFGALPGAGPSIAAFLAYALEKRVSRDPARFGKGAVEGIAAPESANNAAVQTAFVPTMSLGIPGSATMAIMLGALMIHGITPGPQLMSEHPQLFWGLIASFWIGNLLLLVLNIPLIGIWVRLLTIPYRFLYPAIIILICVGVYSVRTNVFDIWLVLLFGLLGYGMRLLRFEPAPLLIGFILGPMVEDNFKRAMILARGDVLALFQRPIAGTLLVLAIIVLLLMIGSAIRRRHRVRGEARSA